MKEAGGKKVVVGFVRDITERKKAEAERQELERRVQLTDRLASIGEMASGALTSSDNSKSRKSLILSGTKIGGTPV